MASIAPEESEVSASRVHIATNSNPRPGSCLRHTTTAVLLFIVSLAYLCIFLHRTSLEPDEGIVLQGAERVLRGELPYRDFFTFYTPGSFYLIAFIFRVFGDSLVMARVSLAISGATCALVTYLLVRRVCSGLIAFLMGLLTTVTGCAYRFLVLHNWYSTVLCCLCLYAAIRLMETKKTIWAIATG